MRISDWSSDVCSSDLAKTLLFENDKAYQVRAVSPDRRYVGLSRIVDNATKHCYVYDRTEAKLIQLTVEGQPVEIGRGSCRERVCQTVYVSVVVGSLIKKT